MSPNDIPRVALDWRPCHRLVASRFPTIGLYDDITAAQDLEVVFAIEALTNPRIRQELGALSLVAPNDRLSGPGATLVMAAFTHLNPEGSRFCDGSYGVYYAALALETAVAEVSHHRAVFLARTGEPEIAFDLRRIQAELAADAAHDIRAGAVDPAALAEICHPSRYAAGQDLGRRLRQAGAQAIVYDSVRHRGGQCAAAFLPRLLRKPRIAGHVGLHWDGKRISHWYLKGQPRPLLAVASHPI